MDDLRSASNSIVTILVASGSTSISHRHQYHHRHRYSQYNEWLHYIGDDRNIYEDTKAQLAQALARIRELEGS
jgi:hypothetical protein